jgi:hypothetical protein
MGIFVKYFFWILKFKGWMVKKWRRHLSKNYETKY